jgi:cold shock CspA family protein
MTRTYEGVVLHWSQKGFGFLFNDEIKRRIFFHVKDWNRATEPVAGENVTFELAPVPGRPDVAINVTPTGNKAKPQSAQTVVKTTIIDAENTAGVRSLAGGTK